MLFNSKIFVAFLAMVLAVYYLLGDRTKIVFLLVVSFIFYGFWDPKLVLLLLVNIAVNWGTASAIAKTEDPGERKRWLWLAVGLDLGILGFFKYYDFFVRELVGAVGLLGVALDPERYLLHLALPIGISFYTFQSLGYVVDVYRRDVVHERNLLKFALYVKFFPQLVAGPVERAPHLLPQFSLPFRLSRAMVFRGVFLVLLGFVKKTVIADRLSSWVAPYFDSLATDGAHAAAAMLLFTTQIYVDFSSYSDIAIGLALVLGYHLRPNFDLPFVVPSIPERWRRWHISMSHWFRDYIFIPLGGSRKGFWRTQLNILIIMFLSGLWHGASNNFLVWGILNGATMVGHRLLKDRVLDPLSAWFGRSPVTRVGYFYVCCLVTYCTIASINIFFRCPDWATAKRFVHAIFGSGLEPYRAALAALGDFPWELQAGAWWTLVVFLFHEGERYLDLQRRILDRPLVWGLVCLALFWSILAFGTSGQQFIYYQF